MKQYLKKFTFICGSFATIASLLPLGNVSAQKVTDWYPVKNVNKPYVRWWWHGSAVDPEGLSFNLSEFSKKGLGGVEITPIFGVQGNENNDIPYLSDKWMQMLRHVSNEANSLGLAMEMNNGTGWPFGGPEVTTDESAQKQIISKWDLKGGAKLTAKIVPEDIRQRQVATVERIMAVSDDKRIDVTKYLTADTLLNWKAPKGKNWKIYALFAGRTFQKVKRAAPGGEGYVVNHYDSIAVKKYLDRFDRAFLSNADIFPSALFNDSYEVYGSDWTKGLFDQFYLDHGYKLENFLPEFSGESGHDELRGRIVRDYRFTLAEMLKKNFTEVWTRWAHSHNALIRNQSHGSPANIIDLYAMVDIPECESFGQSSFDIPGLHPSGPTRHSDADPAVLKFASSAAHVAGKNLVSAETLTWLTEHFHTSLSLCKPEIDQMLASGVNHIFFHGAPYSPKGVDFPGWLFYASINMSPTNIMWPHASGLFDYIARCQAFLTAGNPDSDVLLYFPIDDIWHRQDGIYMMFDIHSMDKKMPDVKKYVAEIVNAGLDMDYLSDALIDYLSVQDDGSILSKGENRYKAIIVPPVDYMPETTLAALKKLSAEGAKVIFTEKLPSDVPGMSDLENRRKSLNEMLKDMPQPAKDMNEAIKLSGALPEQLRSDGMRVLRRRNEAGGWNYFLALLSDNPVDGWVSLATPSKSVIIFNPLNGEKGKAQSKTSTDGNTMVRLQMKPGESLLLKTLQDDVNENSWSYYKTVSQPIEIDKGWSISFLESVPSISGVFSTDSLISWTDLPLDDARVNYGTARYQVQFSLPDNVKADDWILNLGDLRECARVFVNGQDAGAVWSVPFEIAIGKYLKPGLNTLAIDVTNLQANRISDFDRRGIVWKIFKDANIASVTNSRKVDFSGWETVPAGLNSAVTLTPQVFDK